MPGYELDDQGTLKNKLGATSSDELVELEADLISARIVEIRLGIGPDGQFNAAYLKAIHRYIFQGVFEWAGHTRNEKFRLSDGCIATENIMNKGSSRFLDGPLIPTALNDIANHLEQMNFLRDLRTEEFAEQAADVMLELNRIHPFREGNGRTQRVFMEQLAKAAGHDLDFRVISKERMIQASITGNDQGDPSMMRRMFDEISDPVRVELLRDSVDKLQDGFNKQWAAADPDVRGIEPKNWNDFYVATVSPGHCGDLRFVRALEDQFMAQDAHNAILFGFASDLPEPHPSRGETFALEAPEKAAAPEIENRIAAETPPQQIEPAQRVKDDPSAQLMALQAKAELDLPRQLSFDLNAESFRVGGSPANDSRETKEQEPKKASIPMEKGEFGPVLDRFEQAGSLHWTTTAAKAEADLAKQFTADAHDTPNKTRFIFAQDKDQVDRLNGMARDLARAQGTLGPDHQLMTSTGPQLLAVGDRIQFVENNKRSGADAGFNHGAIGTVTRIHADTGKPLLSVQPDSGKGLNVAIGNGQGEISTFRHAYAGRVQKDQVENFDQTYVLISAGSQADTVRPALTMRPDRVSVFIPVEAAADKAALVKLIERHGAKRAAVEPFSGLANAVRLESLPVQSVVPQPVPARPAPAADKSQKAVPPLLPASVKTAPVAAKGASREALGPPEKAAVKAASPVRQELKAGLLAGTAFVAISKVATKAFEGVSSAIEGLFAPPVPMTPEEKIEVAKLDAVAAKDEAVTAAKAVEEQRLELERHDQAKYDALAGLYPPERAQDRLREEQERETQERDDDRGRVR